MLYCFFPGIIAILTIEKNFTHKFAHADAIAGVLWGNSGVNIASQPFLEEIVVYKDDGGAEWTVNVNSTGEVRELGFSCSISFY